MRLLGIPDALRKFGLEPVEVDGWKVRGLEFTGKPIITLRHWTAGPKVGKAPSLGICTHGRADLPGPLCQVLQERTGGSGFDRVYVVASGRANHAGTGIWAGVNSGNRMGTGNEIEWSGPGEAFSTKRRETSERVAAALLSLSQDPNGKYACEHREYALPAGRKIDTNLNGNTFRATVHGLLHPVNPPEEDEVADQIVYYKHPDPVATSTHAYRVLGLHGKWCVNTPTVELLKALGVKEANTRETALDSRWQNTVILVDGPCKNALK